MAVRESPPTPQAGRIKDARGRNVTQPDLVTIRVLRQHDVIPRDTVEEIAREIGDHVVWAPRILLWGSWLGVVGLCASLAYSVPSLIRGRIGWISLACNTVPFAAMWLGLLVISIRGRREGRRLITWVMLKHWRCPHCGYDMHGLPVHPADGATVCPECGCAWGTSLS